MDLPLSKELLASLSTELQASLFAVLAVILAVARIVGVSGMRYTQVTRHFGLPDGIALDEAFMATEAVISGRTETSAEAASSNSIMVRMATEMATEVDDMNDEYDAAEDEKEAERGKAVALQKATVAASKKVRR